MEDRPARRGFLDRLRGPPGTLLVSVSDRTFLPGEELRADVTLSLNRPVTVQALKCAFSGIEAALAPGSADASALPARIPRERLILQTATRQHTIAHDLRRLDAPESSGASTLEAGTRTYSAVFRIPEDAVPTLDAVSCGSVHYMVRAFTEPPDALKTVARPVRVRASRSLPLPDPDPTSTVLEPSPQGLALSLETPPEWRLDAPLRGRAVLANPRQVPVSQLRLSLVQVVKASGSQGAVRGESSPLRLDISYSQPHTRVDFADTFEFKPPGDRATLTPSFRGAIVSVSHAVEAVAEGGPGGRARARRPIVILPGGMV